MIKLIQLVCPARHCNVSTVVDDQVEPDVLANFKNEFENLIAKKVLRRRCGICGSQQLVWEVKDTKFASLDVAQRVMKALQIKEFAIRTVLEALNQTVDAQEKLAGN